MAYILGNREGGRSTANSDRQAMLIKVCTTLLNTYSKGEHTWQENQEFQTQKILNYSGNHTQEECVKVQPV